MGFVAAVTTLALSAAGISAVPAFADDNGSSGSITNTEITQALTSTGVLADTSTDVATDADSALVSNQDDTTVDVPKDPSDGIAVKTNGDKFSVMPPGANNADDSTKIATGVVAYKNDDTAAVVQNTDTGIRMMTVIDNASAPTDYKYNVDLPTGGSIVLNDDGSASVLGSDNTPIAYVPVPWAKDANGNTVQTHFTTDGTSLTQHVQHNVDDVAYPVTADPWWSFLFTAKTWINGAKFLAKKLGPWGVAICLIGGSWAFLRSDSRGWLRVGDAVVGCIA